MQNLLTRLPKIRITSKIYLDLPESPGVYIYFKNNLPIYVGKAINLKRRISSYFAFNLEPKTKRLMDDAEYISYIKVSSEFEALLLEAKLIKLYLPKYNIIAKDDKHPLYIQITDEKYPRVITARKSDLKNIPDLATYGPFPSSGNVKGVLKMLRRIFPYSEHKIGKRACLYSQIGLCDPCPNRIEEIKNEVLKLKNKKQYHKNIRNIRSLLNGNINSLKKDLEKEMKNFSVHQNFEEAAAVRNKIQKLEYITNSKTPVDHYIENPNLYEDIRNKELADFKKILDLHGMFVNSLKRIECFDVAHISGSNATASMVTFIEGTAEKSLYRHFRIIQKRGNDDYESMLEVSRRRKKHLSDWGRPDLIVVDGGKGQLSVFLKEFEKDKIPVVGLAKRFETLIIPIKNSGKVNVKEYRFPKGPTLNLMQRIRDEAHRFAQLYHHRLFSRSLFES